MAVCNGASRWHSTVRRGKATPGRSEVSPGIGKATSRRAPRRPIIGGSSLCKARAQQSCATLSSGLAPSGSTRHCKAKVWLGAAKAMCGDVPQSKGAAASGYVKAQPRTNEHSIGGATDRPVTPSKAKVRHCRTRCSKGSAKRNNMKQRQNGAVWWRQGVAKALQRKVPYGPGTVLVCEAQQGHCNAEHIAAKARHSTTSRGHGNAR